MWAKAPDSHTLHRHVSVEVLFWNGQDTVLNPNNHAQQQIHPQQNIKPQHNPHLKEDRGEQALQPTKSKGEMGFPTKGCRYENVHKHCGFVETSSIHAKQIKTNQQMNVYASLRT